MAVQHLDHRPLEDLVLQRGDPERSLPPVRLRDVHPPRRPRPVAPAMNPSMQIPKVLLEIQPVVLPRHAVHPRRGLRLKRPVRRPQAIDIDVVQERGEPRFLVRCCHSAHTIQPTERAVPGTGSGARFAGRVPLGRSAFPPPPPPPRPGRCSAVGSPGASQLPAPTDPGVTVSRHRALLTSRQYARTHLQWANRRGSRSCSPAHHRLNRLKVRNRRYFFPAQRLR